MAEKIFNNTKEAFKFFIKEIYPTLSSDDKVKLRKTKHDFLSERVNVSENKMEEVLVKFANVEIKKTTEIIFK